MQIKPATRKRLTECSGIILLQDRLEDSSPSKTHQPCLGHPPAQANRRTHFFTGEIWELLTIFVPTRVMRQQISGSTNCQSPQSHHARPWNPTELGQELIDLHYSNGAALRSACTCS